MNFGPLEFADYLRRKNDDRAGEPDAVRAARAAAPAPQPLDARLTVVDASRMTPACGDGRAATRDPGGDSEL